MDQQPPHGRRPHRPKACASGKRDALIGFNATQDVELTRECVCVRQSRPDAIVVCGVERVFAVDRSDIERAKARGVQMQGYQCALGAHRDHDDLTVVSQLGLSSADGASCRREEA